MKLSTFLVKSYFVCPFWNYFASNLLFWRKKNFQDKPVFKGRAQYKKICVFAHFDDSNHIADYVINYLAEIHNNGFDIIFVSTCRSLNWQVISLYCYKIILRDNIGLDFGSYKCGIQAIEQPDQYQKLLIANDSVYGPFRPLTNIFQQMQNSPFWGLTMSYEYAQHLQSYFLVLDKSVWHSKAFKKFWQRVRLLKQRKLIIVNYEIGFSQYMQQAGFKLESFVPETIAKHSQVSTCHYYWRELITNYPFPFIKLNLLAHKQAPSITEIEKVLKNDLNFDKINALKTLMQHKASKLND
jgi:rhamnosyltransferase